MAQIDLLLALDGSGPVGDRAADEQLGRDARPCDTADSCETLFFLFACELRSQSAADFPA